MKELSIEQKAIRYDEVVKMAKIEKEKSRNLGLLEFIDENFPELKESEDEKIRKELIIHVQYLVDYYNDSMPNYSKWLAWLEKQGEQKLADIDNKFLRMRETKPANIVEFLDRLTTVEQEFLWEHIAKIRELDKDERKPADKVESKFKVRDWIVNNISKAVFLIKGINNGYCTLEDIKGNIISPCLPPCESGSHLWTIKDAKDGDVLMSRSPFIYGKQCPYGGLDWYTNKFIKASNFIFTDSPVHPATKEQRDILFQKMKEAGYEWDAEKKELKKIEHKPTDVRTTGYWHVEDVEQKLTDEEMKELLQTEYEKGRADVIAAQWKPREIQKDCIEQIIDGEPYNRDVLIGLFNDLKKL